MKIKLLPTNQELEVNPNKTLLQICTDNKIEIKSICKGVPSCAECRVNIVQGEHNILPPSKAELALIGTSYFVDQRRLSCQVRCFGDVTIDISEQIERAEFQTKKVRGFRTPGQKGFQTQTLAKQGTLVLEETPSPAASEGASEKTNSESGQGRNQARRHHNQQQNQSHNQNQNNRQNGPKNSRNNRNGS